MFSQTEISGVISSNTEWDTNGNPYIIIDDTVVMNGVTLSISPGAEVLFYDNMSLRLLSGAKLIAEGSAIDSIYFDNFNDNLSNGIIFDIGAVGSTVEDDTTYISGSIFSYINLKVDVKISENLLINNSFISSTFFDETYNNNNKLIFNNSYIKDVSELTHCNSQMDINLFLYNSLAEDVSLVFNDSNNGEFKAINSQFNNIEQLCINETSWSTQNITIDNCNFNDLGRFYSKGAYNKKANILISNSTFNNIGQYSGSYDFRTFIIGEGEISIENSKFINITGSFIARSDFWESNFYTHENFSNINIANSIFYNGDTYFFIEQEKFNILPSILLENNLFFNFNSNDFLHIDALEAHNNAFIDIDSDNLIYFNQGSTEVQDITNNYYGTKSSMIIDSMIFDFYDDNDYDTPIANCEPFLLAPNISLPSSPSEIFNIVLKSNASYETLLGNNIQQGDTLFIEIEGFDAEPLLKGFTSVVVINTTTEDSLIKTLIESSEASGLFRGEVYVSNITDDINDVIRGEDGQAIQIISRVDIDQELNLNIIDETTIIYGCTNPDATNYDETANVDDGSCIYPDNGDYSLNFDGVDDYVEIMDGIIPLNGDFVIDAVLTSSENYGGHREAISQGGAEVPSIYIGHSPLGKIRIGGNWSEFGIFPFGSTNRFTVVKQSNSSYLYINGELLYSINYPIENPVQSSTVFGNNSRIINEINYNEWWKGNIDNVSIWNISLSPEEIQTLLASYSYNEIENLVAYYKFNAGDDTTLYDHSGNQNHGTINGARWIANGTKHVTEGGSDETGSGSVDNPFSSIQYAIDMASDGDIILVSAGTYVENIVWPATNGIKLIGSGVDDCFIDGNELASVIRFEGGSNIDSTTLITGFTIQDGYAQGDYPYQYGGGMYLNDSSPTLTDMTFSGNSAHDGGGIYFDTSNSNLLNVTINGNTANHNGAGMCINNSELKINNSLIESNISEQRGGGMHSGYSYLNITNTQFNNNISKARGGGIYINHYSANFDNVEISGNSLTNHGTNDGGGIYCRNANLYLSNSTISDNNANYGAGIKIEYDVQAYLENVIFSDNSPTFLDMGQVGMGIYCSEASLSASQILLYNNTTDDCCNSGNINRGSGMYFHEADSVLLNNITLSGSNSEEGGAIEFYNSNYLSINNSILWGNSPSQLFLNSSEGYGMPTAFITFSNFEGGFEGEGNIDADPLFCDAENGDFTVQSDSPVLGAGQDGTDMGGYGVGCDNCTDDFDNDGICDEDDLDDDNDGVDDADDCSPTDYWLSLYGCDGVCSGQGCGDINDDGEWNIVDIIAIANCVLNDNCPDVVDDPFAADVNNDGLWNVLDILSLALCVLFDSCADAFDNNDACIDIDGNVYETVQIGDQRWMAENLKVTRYNNGDEIPTGYSDDDWLNLSSGAYAIYDDAASNADVYGNLYNWHAVDDDRGICPNGWHVPSDEEYSQLSDFLGGHSVAGGKMKSTGTIEGGDGFWTAPNEGATNESGFTAFPSGYRSGSGGFYFYKGEVSYLWTSTQYDKNSSHYRELVYNDIYLGASQGEPSINFAGYSIRCLQD